MKSPLLDGWLKPLNINSETQSVLVGQSVEVWRVESNTTTDVWVTEQPRMTANEEKASGGEIGGIVSESKNGGKISDVENGGKVSGIENGGKINEDEIGGKVSGNENGGKVSGNENGGRKVSVGDGGKMNDSPIGANNKAVDSTTLSSSSTPPNPDDNFDTILTKLGTGKWNIFYVVAMAYWYSLLPYHTVAGAFMAPDVDHTCHLPPNAQVYTTDQHFNNSHSKQNDSCSYLVEVSEGYLEEQPCTQWDFDDTFTSTVTSEFQLVCGKKYARATYQSMYMFGMLVGALFNGFLADRFGRKTMITISTLSYTVIALGSAWLPTMWSLLTARFFLGTMHPTSLQTGYILVLEVTELRMRSKIGLFQFFSWSTGTILFAAWAYFIRDWRWLQTAVSLPCLLFLPALYFLGESPRWLAVVGQHQRALKEVKRAAVWNKVTLPPDQELLDIMYRVQEKAVSVRPSKDTSKSTIWTKLYNILMRTAVLFKTPKLRLITIVMCVDYFVVAMLFFGLTLGASSLNVNHFVYVAIAGLVELPSATIMIPIVMYFGRRKMLIFDFAGCAAALLAQPLISEDLKWLSVVLVMIGKMLSTAAFNIVFLYSLELIPTELRTQGMSAGMMSSRAGAIVAPFIMSALDSHPPWSISVVFGCFAAVAAVVVFPLWETMNTKLPDTLADLEGYTNPGLTLDEETTTQRSNENKNERDTAM
ncbi:hypothetical protein Pcinc_025338 [Petrolisthes cinctipes]|uniref:Major facilitator superfamily (MFS) profile domain-containing protein n=1 Tax=Petrolisthes cinctipes TaxID=88211 RepID=A0AAE1F823_PETCI|nr:hypothetical protein Pcinc_025338 [Petrolisthes cinctipes]